MRLGRVHSGESRMREICMSGLTRERCLTVKRQTLSTLPDHPAFIGEGFVTHGESADGGDGRRWDPAEGHFTQRRKEGESLGWTYKLTRNPMPLYSHSNVMMHQTVLAATEPGTN
jgi:hypothetical protein